MNESFTTYLKPNEIELYCEDSFKRDKDDTVHAISATVDWSIDIELRGWGIKSIGKFIKSVEINLTRYDYDDKAVEQIKIIGEGFSIVTEDIRNMSPSQITVVALEVDFKKKEIKVIF